MAVAPTVTVERLVKGVVKFAGPPSPLAGVAKLASLGWYVHDEDTVLYVFG
jgi:hypothetical protein